MLFNNSEVTSISANHSDLLLHSAVQLDDKDNTEATCDNVTVLFSRCTASRAWVPGSTLAIPPKMLRCRSLNIRSH